MITMQSNETQQPTVHTSEHQSSVTQHTTDQRSTDQRTTDQQTAAQPAQPRDRSTGFAITSFVLGIASIVAGWTVVTPIIGLVFGVLALRRQTAERTLALWGTWINAGLLALGALLVTLGIGVAALGFLGGAFLSVLG